MADHICYPPGDCPVCELADLDLDDLKRQLVEAVSFGQTEKVIRLRNAIHNHPDYTRGEEG